MTNNHESSIVLYAYVTSVYAMKVHCYLLYKQLPFKVFYVNPLNPEKELPVGRQVPVLKIGEVARGESSSLGIWLDEIFPDTLQLVPEDMQLQHEVFNIDHWVTKNLIPTIFYSIYPQYNTSLLRNISNALRLGYCVDRTTTKGLPFGMRFMWPLLIRRAGFIRRMIAPIAKDGTVSHCRTNTLSYLEEKLQGRKYLAGTDTPSLADLSAWPSLIMPYKTGLKGFDDFKSYPNILRWAKNMETFMIPSDHAPPLIPEFLVLRDL